MANRDLNNLNSVDAYASENVKNYSPRFLQYNSRADLGVVGLVTQLT